MVSIEHDEYSVKYYNYSSYSSNNQHQCAFKFTMRGQFSSNMTKTKSLLETNLYQSSINVKELKHTSKEFEFLGVSYFKTSYLTNNFETNFSCAIVPKRTTKARNLLQEIETQNSYKLDMFIKPILYYYDATYLYILYPVLQKKVFKIEKSSKAIYRTVKELLGMYKTLHDKKVALRSLTLNNIFVEKNNQRLLRSHNLMNSEELENQEIKTNNFYSILEPLEFNPPEIFERGWIDKKGDIWALGVLLFKLVNGILPFNHRTYDFNIPMKPHYMESFSRNVPADLQNLIKNMLALDPCNRITMDEILMDTWVQEQSMVYGIQDQEIDTRVRKKIEEQKSSWKFFKNLGENITNVGKSVVGLDLCGINVTTGVGSCVRETGSFLKRNLSAPMLGMFRKTFQCYDDTGDTTEKTLEMKREQLAKRIEAEEERRRKNEDLKAKKVKQNASSRHKYSNSNYETAKKSKKSNEDSHVTGGTNVSKKVNRTDFDDSKLRKSTHRKSLNKNEGE